MMLMIGRTFSIRFIYVRIVEAHFPGFFHALCTVALGALGALGAGGLYGGLMAGSTCVECTHYGETTN